MEAGQGLVLWPQITKGLVLALPKGKCSSRAGVAGGRAGISWDKWTLGMGSIPSGREQHLRRFCAEKEQGNQTSRNIWLFNCEVRIQDP